MVSSTSAERPVNRISSHRPAELGIRLLGKRARSEQTGNNCRAFVFLMDNLQLAWIVQSVQLMMTRCGYSCRLHRLNETSLGDQQPYERLDEHQYLLLPTTSVVESCSFDHLVLLLPANLEAVLTAYQNIKQLAKLNTPDIAVILVGAPNHNAAWHHFRRLAIGVMRYLDIPLLNLGHLPDQAPPQAGLVNQDPDHCLAPIVERLLRSEFYTALPEQKFAQQQR